MNALEAMLAIALLAIAVAGGAQVVEDHYDRKQADDLRDDLLSLQEALLVHQRSNPMDRISDWGADWQTDDRHFAKLAQHLDTRFTQRTWTGETDIGVDAATVDFRAFGLSPYAKPFAVNMRTVGTGVSAHRVLEVSTEVVGLERASHVMHALAGLDARIVPQPDEAAHNDATSFDVRYRIRPSIKALLAENVQGQGSVYRRNAVTDEIELAGMKTPLRFADDQYAPATLYTDGIAHGVACPPAPQVVTVTATGHVLYCHDDGTGNWTWRPLVPQEAILAEPSCYIDRNLAFSPRPTDPGPTGNVYVFPEPYMVPGGAPVQGCVSPHAMLGGAFRSTSLAFTNDAATCGLMGGTAFTLPPGWESLDHADLVDPYLPAAARRAGGVPANYIIVDHTSQSLPRCECASGTELVANGATASVAFVENRNATSVRTRSEARDGYDAIPNASVDFTTLIDGHCAAEDVTLLDRTPRCAGVDRLWVDMDIYGDPDAYDYPTCSDPPVSCPSGYTYNSTTLQCEQPPRQVLQTESTSAPHWTAFNFPPGAVTNSSTVAMRLIEHTYSGGGWTCGAYGGTQPGFVDCPDPWGTPAHFHFETLSLPDHPPAGDQASLVHPVLNYENTPPGAVPFPARLRVWGNDLASLGVTRLDTLPPGRSIIVPQFTHRPDWTWEQTTACPEGYIPSRLTAAGGIEQCIAQPAMRVRAPGPTSIDFQPSNPRCPTGYTMSGTGRAARCDVTVKAQQLPYQPDDPRCLSSERRLVDPRGHGVWCASVNTAPPPPPPLPPPPPPPQVTLTVDQTAITVPEGGTGLFNASLTALPSFDVLVTVAITGCAGKATVAPPTLTFTPLNGTSDQPVTVTGLQDDSDFNNEDCTIELRSSAGNEDVSATVLDDDTPPQALQLSPASVTITEGSVSATVTSTLLNAPTGNVVVSFTTSIPASAMSRSRSSCTLSPSTYATGCAVVLTAIHDAGVSDHSGTFTASASSIPSERIQVTVRDDDTQAIDLGPSSDTLTEGGAGGNFTVTLRRAPSSTTSITLSLSSGLATKATLSSTACTLNASSYATGCTITVTPRDDADDRDESGSLRARSAGITGDASAITILDDDTQEIHLAPASITIHEGGATVTATASLRVRPASNVTIVFGKSVGLPNSALTLSPATCVIAPSAYASGCSTTLTAPVDANATGETGELRAAVSGGGIPTVSVPVTVVEPPIAVNLQIGPDVSLTEGSAASGVVRVTLDAQPAANVRVTLTLSAQLSGKVSQSRTACTLTPSNHASITACPVALRALDDTDTSDESGSITASASGISSASASVTVDDDDTTQRVIFEPSPATVNEGGSITMTASLHERPASATTITFLITGMPSGSVSVNPAICVIQPDNHATGCDTTLTGLQDSDTSDESGNMGARPNPSGFPWGITPTTVLDDDVQRLQIAPSNLILDEGGSTGTLSVTLAQRPAGQVNIGIAESASIAAAITLSRSSCSLHQGNYSSPSACRITVTPIANDADHDDETGDVIASATGLNDVHAGITVTDDDTTTLTLPALLIGPDLALTEGGAAGTMRITLDAQPASNVTVGIDLSSSLAGKASISTTTCTLTPANYAHATACPVLVTPLPDTDSDDEGGSITASASGISSVAARVTVDDPGIPPPQPATLTLSPATQSVSSGTTTSLNLDLSSRPPCETTVRLSSTSPVASSSSSFIFSPGHEQPAASGHHQHVWQRHGPRSRPPAATPPA